MQSCVFVFAEAADSVHDDDDDDDGDDDDDDDDDEPLDLGLA